MLIKRKNRHGFCPYLYFYSIKVLQAVCLHNIGSSARQINSSPYRMTQQDKQQTKQTTVTSGLNYAVIGNDSLKITTKKNYADGGIHDIL